SLPPADPGATGQPQCEPGRNHAGHAEVPDRLPGDPACAQPDGPGVYGCDEHERLETFLFITVTPLRRFASSPLRGDDVSDRQSRIFDIPGLPRRSLLACAALAGWRSIF